MAEPKTFWLVRGRELTERSYWLIWSDRAPVLTTRISRVWRPPTHTHYDTLIGEFHGTEAQAMTSRTLDPGECIQLSIQPAEVDA